MLIDFVMAQKIRFDRHASVLCTHPERYFFFDEIADVYVADWLKGFPQGTTCRVSGLDDGAEEYCIQIAYKDQSLLIDLSQPIKLIHRDRDGVVQSIILN